MSTSINATNNTTIDIGRNIIVDVYKSVGTESFVPTFVEAYKRGISKRTFTLNQWRALQEMFRDNEDSWNAIFDALKDKMPIAFADDYNGNEDYILFTVWPDGHYDYYHHGYGQLVVKKDGYVRLVAKRTNN